MVLPWRKLILLGLAAILAGLVATFSVLLHQTWQEYRAFSQREAMLATRLAAIQKDAASRQAFLEKLHQDPDFLERIVRERLGYARPGDILYRFPDAPPPAPPPPKP